MTGIFSLKQKFQNKKIKKTTVSIYFKKENFHKKNFLVY